LVDKGHAGRNASEFTGFSTMWYGKALGNTFLITALQNSLMIAFTSAGLAAIFGTMAAIGMQRLSSRGRAILDGLFAAAIVVPGVVIGIATLVALVEVFSFLNPALASIWPGDKPPQLGLGYGSIIAAHGLFSLALVTMIVKARIASLGRDIVEASSDLYATPFTTFRQIVLPQILPSVLAGFLLAFTFSFDDFIVAFFVARLEDDAADLRVCLDQARRNTGDQRDRHHGSDRLAADDPDCPRADARQDIKSAGRGVDDDPERPGGDRHRRWLRHRPGGSRDHGARGCPCRRC
jgi:spermidine/putrescine transport system permease protein